MDNSQDLDEIIKLITKPNDSCCFVSSRVSFLVTKCNLDFIVTKILKNTRKTLHQNQKRLPYPNRMFHYMHSQGQDNYSQLNRFILKSQLLSL